MKERRLVEQTGTKRRNKIGHQRRKNMKTNIKIKIERGPWKKIWKKNIRVPRLHHVDFNNITGLLTQKLIVEEFNVNDICRSCQTGEYFYANEDYEWMPETFLFDTVVAARREKTRILNMLKGWTKDNG